MLCALGVVESWRQACLWLEIAEIDQDRGTSVMTSPDGSTSAGTWRSGLTVSTSLRAASSSQVTARSPRGDSEQCKCGVDRNRARSDRAEYLEHERLPARS